MLISGESGAGKTEAMKICLTYVSEASRGKGQRVSDEVQAHVRRMNSRAVAFSFAASREVWTWNVALSF